MSFDAFVAHVFADEALQVELAAHRDPATFLECAVERASARDIVLDPTILAPHLGPDPVGLHRFQPPFVGGSGWPPRGWIPTGFFQGRTGPGLTWLYFGPDPLRRPFFETSVADVRDLPFNRLFRYGMALGDIATGAPDASPPLDGFIFHMSRCGSTLVAQMLAAAPDHVVVSEASIIDTLVQFVLAGQAPVELLRATILALTRDRSGTTRRRFVKFDHWHMLVLPLIRAAFPDVPCVFLYRDPVEVLVSQRRIAGIQPQKPVVSLALPGVVIDRALDGESYAAWLLDRICRAALDADPPIECVGYSALPDALFDTILPHFGVVPTVDEHAAMFAATGRDAKTPERSFNSDVGDKQREATADLRAIAARYCGDSDACLRAATATAIPL